MLYTVKSGDSLYSIAQSFGVTSTAISSGNHLWDDSKLPIGMNLIIPTGGTPERRIVVNGYAFPTISDTALMGALPYLTYLSVFTARAQSDGSIVPMNDDAIIRRAYVNGVAPLMTLTNQRDSGEFSSEIAHAILADPAVGNALIQNIAVMLDRRNYFGINLDFEYILPEDRDLYTDFVRRLRDRLKQQGYLLAVAVAPKTSDAQQGLLYTAHDYAALGEIVDYCIIMTYEWGYTYGEPMAVSPLDKVEEVIAYAVSVMPPEKILMGLPNYGYNWQLPFSRSNPARTISLSEAPRLAYDQLADIRFDQASQSPYFRYYHSTGREHITWFDDPRSIYAKLELVEKYGLGGVSVWNINKLYRAMWLTMGELFGVKKAF